MNEPQNQGNVSEGQANSGNQAGQQQAPVQNVPQPQSTPEPQDNPVNSRTKEQFDKLLESNRKLYEQNQQLQQQLQPVPQPTPQPQPQRQQVPSNQQVDPRDFIERDPVTGEQYINESKMKNRIQEIEEMAKRAEEKLNSFVKTSEQREIDRQNAEAFSAYPELEPGSEEFNANFSKQVRSVIYDSLLNFNDYGGRPLSFREAADYVKEQYNPGQPTPPQGGGEKPTGESVAPQANAKKEQSAAQAQSTPQNAPQQTSSEELVQMRLATRMGDDSALAARILATEHVRGSE